MRIAFSLLSQLVDLKDITPKLLAERLTLSGLEVSGISDRSGSLDRVVVGRILKVSPHPHADKLSLTEVEVPGEVLHIVCGAKNISAGDLVPVALVGAELPGGLRIKPAVLRGETSHGMLCSERELGVSSEHAGIMHFPAGTEPGTSVAELLGLDDVLLEVEVTPNRSDCLSHLGVARQAAAVLERPLTVPAVSLQESDFAASELASVSIEPHCGCGRYCARIIRGVRIGASPAWLRRALERLGQRSVNNVVDATNYVMLMLGHPLHAFDLDRLAGPRILARQARPNEELVTLDGVVRKFSGGELVIADAERPVAVAGIMGGRDSEVTDRTTNLLLEAAWFDPRAVRRTSRGLGLTSEASFRFERGTDPEQGLTLCLDRAAQLFAELAGGTVLRGVLDSFPERPPQRHVRLRLARAEQVLGLELSWDRGLAALTRLGFRVGSAQTPGEYVVEVPSFRPDVTLEEDLIEEIAEVLGYDQIPVTTPRVLMQSPAPDPGRVFLRQAREAAAGLGATEVITYSFMDPGRFRDLALPEDHPWRTAVALRNPLNAQTSLLRTSLLPGLLETLAYNHHRGQERIYLFEVGAVYLPEPAQDLPREPQHLGAVLCGPRHPLDWRQGRTGLATDLYDLKGWVGGVWTRLRLGRPGDAEDGLKWVSAVHPFLHPDLGFDLQGPDGRTVGWAGRLHPRCQEAYKLKDEVFAAELDVAALARQRTRRTGVQAFSRFPATRRDLSLAVPETVRAGEVLAAIREAGGPTLVEATAFDLYRGEGLPAGTKSLAFALTFQAEDRTLQEEELRSLQAGILERVTRKFGAQQR